MRSETPADCSKLSKHGIIKPWQQIPHHRILQHVAELQVECTARLASPLYCAFRVIVFVIRLPVLYSAGFSASSECVQQRENVRLKAPVSRCKVQAGCCNTAAGKAAADELECTSKLRWYFAIAKFDSAATASHMYKECSMFEFSNSPVPFDLRLVPESSVFTHLQVCRTEDLCCLIHCAAMP